MSIASISLKADSNPPLQPLRMFHNATAMDPLPSVCDGGCEAASAMGFPPWYVCKMEKIPQLGPYPTPQPVCCVTKSSNEEHILGHIWLKSAV